MTHDKLTIAERILLAAKDLQSTGRFFTAEALVVRAWEKFPDHFGLQGYSDQYPDSNRVLTKIMGKTSPLRQKGWISKIGTKKYRLTEVGAINAKEIGDRQTPEKGKRLASLSRPLTSVLRRLLSSTAITKFPPEADQITFGDLCSFWNISPRSTAHQLAVRSAEVEKAISLAREKCGEQPLILPEGDVVVRPEDLDTLDELNMFLEERFQRDLAVIRGRTDERRSRALWSKKSSHTSQEASSSE